MKKNFSLIIVLFSSFILFAQAPPKANNFLITGKIVDALSQQAMGYTTVSVFNQSDSSIVTGAVTDDNGIFTIATKKGQYFIKIEFISYQEKIVENITIGKSNPRFDVGTIALEQSATNLDEIEVRAEKSSMQIALDKKVFNVGKDLANQGGSAEDILDNVPSVTVDVEGNVSLRGQGNVRILVDGKPSTLVGSDGSGLKNIPANLIDKIEVVTNPSARYDAEGMTGIVNIVLKKDKKKGVNGSFDVNVGYPDSYGAAINMNFRKKKVNFFLNLGARYRTGIGKSDIYLEYYNNDSTFILDQNQDRTRSGFSGNIRTGIDYFINPKTTITGAFSFNKGEQNNTSEIVYTDYINSFANKIGSNERNDKELETKNNLEYSINFNRKFSKKDHQWTADIQYSLRAEIEDSDINEDAFNADGTSTNTATLFQTSKNDESYTNLLIQTDYVYPFHEKGKFEIGARLNLRDVKNDILVQELQNNEWETLVGLTNDFHYDENIYAVYSSYGDKFGKFSFQTGLRFELSNIETYLEQTNSRNPRDYSNFFPSLFLNYEFSEKSAIQGSYSRRIRRPRHRELNPFFSFSNPRNFYAGNPNINPEFTDSYEVAYLKYWSKATLSSSIYYRHTTDVVQRIKTIELETGNTTTLPENIGFDDSYGLELTFSYDPFKWWRINGDANFFRSITDGTEYSEDLFSDTYTWFGRITSRTTLWKSLDVQIRGNYRAPRDTPQGSTDAIYHFDIGMSKDILKKNGTLTFGVRDVFNSRKRNYSQQTLTFYSSGVYQRRVRQWTLSLNYRLNQKKRRGGNRGGGRGQGGEDF